MNLKELSLSELYALYNLAKEMQILEHNKARVNTDGIKTSEKITTAFNRMGKIITEINNRLSELD